VLYPLSYGAVETVRYTVRSWPSNV